MVATSESMRLGIVRETTHGVTPDNPIFEVLRITGESLSFSVTAEESPELAGVPSTGSRASLGSSVTGGETSGDINFILHQCDAIDDLIAGVLANDWGVDPGAIGISADEIYDSDTRISFTIEKMFALEEGDIYHRFLNCSIDTMTLTIVPNANITGTFGIQGGEFITDDDPIGGATYNPPSDAQRMTAPLVTGIVLYDENGLEVFDMDTACWTNLVLSFNNNSRGIACIGTLGNKEVVLAGFSISIAFSVFLTSNILFEKMLGQENMELVVTCSDPDGNVYQFSFPRLKVSEATSNAGGRGEDLLVSGTFTGQLGPDPKLYGVLITRAEDTSETEAVAAGAGPGSTAATITLSGTKGNGGQQIVISITPDSSAAVVLTYDVPLSATVNFQAAEIADMIDSTPEFNATATGAVVTVTPQPPTTHITALTIS